MEVETFDTVWNELEEDKKLDPTSTYYMRKFKKNERVYLGLKNIGPNEVQKGIILIINANTKKIDQPECKSFSIEYDNNDSDSYLVWWGLNDESYYEYFKYMAFHVAYETDEEQQDKKCLSTFFEKIVDWQNFLSNEKEKPTRSHTLGLFGEILYLNYLVDENLADIETVIEGWHEGAPKRDFYFNKGAIEIKTTSVNPPKRFKIGSVDQLDTANTNLLLGIVRVFESDSDGIYLNELIEKTIDKIKITDPHLVEKFKKKLYKEKCLFLIPNYYRKWKFSKNKIETFKVIDNFPRITPNDIINLNRIGVESVKYEINYNKFSKFEATLLEIKSIV